MRDRRALHRRSSGKSAQSLRPQLVLAALLLTGNPAHAQPYPAPCPGDFDGDGRVSIDELVEAVGNALRGCPPHDESICGDAILQDGEDCDDGDHFGGDGCAKNCTFETARLAVFEDSPDADRRTVVRVQTAAVAFNVFVSGQQEYVTGEARRTAVRDPDGRVLTSPDEIPVVVPADRVAYEPVGVAGLVCACIRGVAVPELFGDGNSADGFISCAADGTANVDYLLTQDHDTTPGSAGNGGGLPDDPECDDSSTFPTGVVSRACLEGADANCSAPNYVHSGVCNSPRLIGFSGGAAPRGSALIDNSTSISLLRDSGTCRESRFPDGRCRFTDYGPDCQPCTDDDEIINAAENLPMTTGTAAAALLDANNVSGTTIGEGELCVGNPCRTSATGSLFDCDALAAGPSGGVSGTALATAFPAIDAEQIGDIVTTTVLVHR